MGTVGEDFARTWFEQYAEGLKGGWDAGRRNAEMDVDGITAEVVFPDADGVESRTCAPFGTGSAGSVGLDPNSGWPALGRTTGGSPNCVPIARSGGVGWRFGSFAEPQRSWD